MGFLLGLIHIAGADRAAMRQGAKPLNSQAYAAACELKL